MAKFRQMNFQRSESFLKIFHQPIKRNKLLSLKSSENKITLKRDNKIKEIDACEQKYHWKIVIIVY